MLIGSKIKSFTRTIGEHFFLLIEFFGWSFLIEDEICRIIYLSKALDPLGREHFISCLHNASMWIGFCIEHTHTHNHTDFYEFSLHWNSQNETILIGSLALINWTWCSSNKKPTEKFGVITTIHDKIKRMTWAFTSFVVAAILYTQFSFLIK